MTSPSPILVTTASDLTLLRRGKVRDVYEAGEDHLLLVATDRISAFDCVLPTAIERKGEVLTALSRFWFNRLRHIVPNHLVTTDIAEMPARIRQQSIDLSGRSMFVRRTDVFPVECVVRGYLVGSGWKDYLQTGEVCGHRLPTGLRESEELVQPIFTPATKAETGHDENISERRMSELIGEEVAGRLRDISLRLYHEARAYALDRGIIIADTKFEFGRDRDGNILLIDEAVTPDSSRFWPAANYHPGQSQPSFDKQFVRDYLDKLSWNKQPPAPPLPAEVAQATSQRYLEAYRILVGTEL